MYIKNTQYVRIGTAMIALKCGNILHVGGNGHGAVRQHVMITAFFGLGLFVFYQFHLDVLK
jgi:hypothetical protein